MQCKECKGEIIQANGYYVCSNCGLIYTDITVDPGYLYERKTTTGLGSVILRSSFLFYDYQGRKLSAGKQRMFSRLAAIQKNIQINNQNKYVSLIKKISASLQLGNIIQDKAIRLYTRTIAKLKKMRNLKSYLKNKKRIAISCLVWSVMDQNIMALSQIVEKLNSMGFLYSKKHIMKVIFELSNILGIPYKRNTCESYLELTINKLRNPQFVSELRGLGINPNKYFLELRNMTFEIYNYVKDLKGARNPYNFASAIVYHAEKNLAKADNRNRLFTTDKLAIMLNVKSSSLKDHVAYLTNVLKTQVKVI